MKKIVALFAAIAFVFCLALGATKHSEKVLKVTPTMAMVGAIVGAGNNRGIYEKTKAEFIDGGGVIAPSYLRAEAYLQNGSQSYTFNFKNLGNEKPTEHKLNEQDAFKVLKVGLFPFIESTTVDGIGVLQTYPNPVIFPDETGYLQNAHLEHLYNGSLFAKKGDTAYLPDQPIMGCRVVRTAQRQAAGTGFGGFAHSERHPQDGFIDLTPQFIVKGNAANEIILRVPGNSNQKVESNFGASGYKTKIALILLGFRITGGASVEVKQL